MHIVSFEIRNFKGIKRAKIELPKPGKNSIISLIGLNESGKTTVLEAISNFVSGDDSISALFSTDAATLPDEGGGPSVEEVYQYVPKAKKANFTDEIRITAKVNLDDDDVAKIAAELEQRKGAKVDKASFGRNIEIIRAYRFKDSKFVSFQNYWTIAFDARVGTQRKSRPITKSENDELWMEAVRVIGAQLPTIVYFPTFLFDFPQKIYLVEHEKETEQNKLYRQVLQDILDSEGSGLELQKHVVERIKPVTVDASTTWSSLFATFGKQDERQQVDAVLNKMSAHMGKVVFGSWNQIFGRQFKNKRIEARIAIDDANGDLPYLEFVIFDGFTPYYLSERSLGFRWFFSFLLFTQFRAARRAQAPAIFLFDEPASNLHAKAQLQLLKGFPNITGNRASVIYSTHSLYLIDPKYLENAYIVENGALDLEGDDAESEFSERDTDIKCTRYRTFVGQNPDRGSYFQPVIDRLNAVHAPVMLPNDVVIVEGKTDYYFMEYVKRKYGVEGVSVFPGAGASSSDVLISLGLGFGRNFIVVADDDKAGRDAIKRYSDEFFIADRAFTIGTLSSQFEGKKLETLFSAKTKDDIKKHLGVSKLQKKHTALFFQEMGVTLEYELDEETKSAALTLFSKIVEKLGDLGE